MLTNAAVSLCTTVKNTVRFVSTEIEEAVVQLLRGNWKQMKKKLDCSNK